MLRVTVVTVGVGPMAKGLLDVHISLRVGQTLLISGEEAKPFGRRESNECPPFDAYVTVFAMPETYSSKHGREQINSRCERKRWRCRSKLF